VQDQLKRTEPLFIRVINILYLIWRQY